jgi:hypothetical protein
MAKDKIQNGQAEYGTVHVMEEEMRAAQQGVFEESSSEAGRKRRRKAEPKAVENKDEGAAPTNKSVAPKPISRESMTTKSSNNRTAAKRNAKK